MNNFRKTFSKYLETTNERIKLQRFYIILAVTSFCVASVVSLINQGLGHLIIFLSILASGLFLVNSIIWVIGAALLETFSLSKKASPKKQK